MNGSNGKGTGNVGRNAAPKVGQGAARPVIPPAPALPKRPLNPHAKPFHPAPQRVSRAYMYTPFGGEDALKAATGENMARLENNKAPHPLLAPSHQAADQLETLRQQKIQNFGRIVNQATQVVSTHKARGRQKDAALLARIKNITDNSSGDADTDAMNKGFAVQNRQFNSLMDNAAKTAAEGNLASYGPRHKALMQTRIVNTSAHLYPQLHPDPPLQNVGRKDKLYVLGHGMANFGGIASTQGGDRTLTSQQLIDHLKDRGLPQDFEDLRLTACQGIAEQAQYNDQAAQTAATQSNYVAPSVFRAAQASGFKQMKVTGYAGDGVTFPFNSERHLRQMSNGDKARRSTKSLQFKPSHNSR